MPTKYAERLYLPVIQAPNQKISFSTQNGLPIAINYDKVIFTERGPLIEFDNSQIVLENVSIPPSVLWRRTQPEAYYVEYRSRDFCGVKIFQQKRDRGELKADKWYISPFDLTSDKYPNLIEPLRKKRKEDNE